MKFTLRTILSVTLLLFSTTALVGCKDSTPPADAPFALDESVVEEDDHDHAEHEGHDHPEHGPRGGHMVKLSDGAETEVHFDEEAELFSIYLDDLGDVSGVKMTTTISGEETVYEFERSDTPVGTVYGLMSPELATAVKMGKDVAATELTITTADGDLTAQYEYHSH